VQGSENGDSVRQSDWQSRCCATHRGPTGPERPTTRPSTLRAGRGRGRARILTKRAINSPRWERRRSGENPQRGPTGPGRPTMRPSPLRAGRGRHGPNHGRRLSALGEEAPKLWVVAISNGVCRIERELTLGRERMLRSELKGKKPRKVVKGWPPPPSKAPFRSTSHPKIMRLDWPERMLRRRLKNRESPRKAVRLVTTPVTAHSAPDQRLPPIERL